MFNFQSTSVVIIVLSIIGDNDEKDGKDLPTQATSNSGSGIQTLDSLQAMCLPLGASISLLVMFFFFDSMQVTHSACCYYQGMTIKD
jgi:hypothetical protein